MTAEVLVADPPHSPAWYDARPHGIGASEVATVLRWNPFQSPLQLWETKTGRVTTWDGNYATRRGSTLEPFLIQELESTTPGMWVETADQGLPSMFHLDGEPVIRCSPDGIGHTRDGDVLVECKAAGARQAHKWRDGGMPDPYTVQCLWSLGVLELPAAVVIADVAGELEQRHITADPAWFQRAADYCLTWWERHIVGDTPPDPDPVADLDQLARVWTPQPGKQALLPAGLVFDLHDAKTAAKEAAARLTEVEARVKCLMRDAVEAVDDNGATVATWKPTNSSPRVDTKALVKAHPRIAKRFTTPARPGRTFLIKTPKTTAEGDLT